MQYVILCRAGEFSPCGPVRSCSPSARPGRHTRSGRLISSSFTHSRQEAVCHTPPEPVHDQRLGMATPRPERAFDLHRRGGKIAGPSLVPPGPAIDGCSFCTKSGVAAPNDALDGGRSCEDAVGGPSPRPRHGRRPRNPVAQPPGWAEPRRPRHSNGIDGALRIRTRTATGCEQHRKGEPGNTAPAREAGRPSDVHLAGGRDPRAAAAAGDHGTSVGRGVGGRDRAARSCVGQNPHKAPISPRRLRRNSLVIP
jgi:hypothetical protein